MKYIFVDSFIAIVYICGQEPSLPSLAKFPYLVYNCGNYKNIKFINLKTNDFKIKATEIFELFKSCFNQSQRNFIFRTKDLPLIFLASHVSINLLSNKNVHHILNKQNNLFNSPIKVEFNKKIINTTIYNYISVSNNDIKPVFNSNNKIIYKCIYTDRYENIFKKVLAVYLTFGPYFKWEKYRKFYSDYLVKMGIIEKCCMLISQISAAIYNKTRNQSLFFEDEYMNSLTFDISEIVNSYDNNLNAIVTDSVINLDNLDWIYSLF